MSDGSSEEKSLPGTPQKLQKQRREGQVAQTTKMASLAVTATTLGALLALGPGMIEAFRGYLDAGFQNMGSPLRPQLVDRLAGLSDLLLRLVVPLAVVAGCAAVLLVILFHKGIPFSVVPLRPDFNRLNPANGVKRLFAARNAVEFGLGLMDIVLWLALGGLVVAWLLPPILALHGCGAPCLGPVAWTLFRRLAYAAIAFCLVQIGIEMLVQRAVYLHEQRMTRTEHKREMKDHYGSPEVRAARNRLRNEQVREAEAGKEHAGVNRANMCFFTEESAVAIRYHPQHAPLPRVAVVAKGREAALELRRAVAENGFRELQDARITLGCLTTRPGMPVPEAVFNDLAQGMARLYS